jgi:hypothetical protein
VGLTLTDVAPASKAAGEGEDDGEPNPLSAHGK